MNEIIFEGQPIQVSQNEIKPGDMYLAKRNTGWKLLTCKLIHPRGYIVPVENAYSFDLHECFRVEGMD